MGEATRSMQQGHARRSASGADRALPPRLIACVDVAPDGEGLSTALCADFIDALAAYECISAQRFGEAETHLPVMQLTGDAQLDLSRATDLVLIAVLPADGREGHASGEVPGTGSVDVLAAFLRSHASARARNARVYAIAVAAGRDEAPAQQALECCADACSRVGLAWSGGVAADGGKQLVRRIHGPRLGFWRRPLSQATDRLILALRLACSMGALDERTALSGSDHHRHLRRPRPDRPGSHGIIDARYPFTRMLGRYLGA